MRTRFSFTLAVAVVLCSMVPVSARGGSFIDMRDLLRLSPHMSRTAVLDSIGMPRMVRGDIQVADSSFGEVWLYDYREIRYKVSPSKATPVRDAEYRFGTAQPYALFFRNAKLVKWGRPDQNLSRVGVADPLPVQKPKPAKAISPTVAAAKSKKPVRDDLAQKNVVPVKVDTVIVHRDSVVKAKGPLPIHIPSFTVSGADKKRRVASAQLCRKIFAPDSIFVVPVGKDTYPVVENMRIADINSAAKSARAALMLVGGLMMSGKTATVDLSVYTLPNMSILYTAHSKVKSESVDSSIARAVRQSSLACRHVVDSCRPLVNRTIRVTDTLYIAKKQTADTTKESWFKRRLSIADTGNIFSPAHRPFAEVALQGTFHKAEFTSGSLADDKTLFGNTFGLRVNIFHNPFLSTKQPFDLLVGYEREWFYKKTVFDAPVDTTVSSAANFFTVAFGATVLRYVDLRCEAGLGRAVERLGDDQKSHHVQVYLMPSVGGRMKIGKSLALGADFVLRKEFVKGDIAGMGGTVSHTKLQPGIALKLQYLE